MMESQEMTQRELKRVAEWKCEDIVFCLSASDDATKLWLGSSDSGVYEFDVTTEKSARRKFEGEGHSSYVTGMARTGPNLVTCSYDKRLIWWDIESRQQLKAIEAHEKWIRRVIATPDHKRVITVADDMRCRVWDAQAAALIGEFSDHSELTPHHYPSMLYAVAVSADGSRIASGDRTGHIAIWDAATLEKVNQLEAPVMYTWDPTRRRHSIGGIRSLSFSPDSEKLAVGGMGKVGNIDHLQGPSRLEVFDIASGDRLLEIEDEKNKGLIEQIVWSSDWIMTAGGAHHGFISVFNSKTGEQVNAEDHSGHVHAFVHDKPFESLFVAAHQRISRWTYAAVGQAREGEKA